MGFFDRFRRKSLEMSPELVAALNDGAAQLNYIRIGSVQQGEVRNAYLRGQSASYGWIYEHRPAVRAVVDYIARNIAQLPLKLYERVGDTERIRDESHPAAQSLLKPDGHTPRDEFIRRLVTDWLVYDNAYLLKFRPDPASQILVLVRVPPPAVQVRGKLTPDFYRIWDTYPTPFSAGTYVDVRPEDVLHWHGYNPDDPLLGFSRLETLRATLTEDQVAQAASVELMKNGLKGGHLERPLEAPTLSDEAFERLRESWRNQGRASPGKTPILEEGTKFVQDTMTMRDAEMLGARKLRFEEVCHVYGVPPGALGLDPSTQLDEQRRQVYADVLPPITNSLACQLNVDILEAEYAADDHYFEFDLNEKLRGDLENRFPAMTASAGRPWLTVNEVRAKENLPPIEGGDELTIPLNVMLAGQGSPALPAPNVMPPQDATKPPQDGSYRQATLSQGATKQIEITTQPKRLADMARQRRYIDEAKGVLMRDFERQRRSAKSRKAFDSARWNDELTKDLHKLIRWIVEREGGIYMARLGGADFDMRQVKNYLAAMAAGIARGLNRVTQRDVEQMGVADALDRATEQRAAVAAASIGTRATYFARTEAAKQAPFPERRMQVWVADTERHADLDGVAVPLDSDWGGLYPGSEPNCACGVEIV